MPDSEVKLPKQWRRWLKAAGLKPAGLKPVYSTDMHRKRRWMGDHYLKGHDRFWRIDCLGNLDMSEPKEQFDRWANSLDLSLPMTAKSEREFVMLVTAMKDSIKVD